MIQKYHKVKIYNCTDKDKVWGQLTRAKEQALQQNLPYTTIIWTLILIARLRVKVPYANSLDLKTPS